MSSKLQISISIQQVQTSKPQLLNPTVKITINNTQKKKSLRTDTQSIW